jgi:thiol-disulfide isomerase/thioredoxin
MWKNVMMLVLLWATSGQLFAQPVVGDQAPDIVLTDLQGREQKLSALQGKLVLVDFWASWCMPCRKSNRELAPLYMKYKGKGFEIFGVSLDEKQQDWKRAVAADKIKWSQVMQAGGWDAPVAMQWKIEQLPTSYLLDKTGKVIAVNPTKSEIEHHLKKALP